MVDFCPQNKEENATINNKKVVANALVVDAAERADGKQLKGDKAYGGTNSDKGGEEEEAEEKRRRRFEKNVQKKRKEEKEKQEEGQEEEKKITKKKNTCSLEAFTKILQDTTMIMYSPKKKKTEAVGDCRNKWKMTNK